MAKTKLSSSRNLQMHVTDFDRWIRASVIADYVSQRQNADGGYTFAQWSESSAQDTYYAIEILKMLGVQPQRRETTISFLQNLQQADGSFDSIKVAYYVTRSLKRLVGCHINPYDYELRRIERDNASQPKL